uniref:Lipoprotein n=2 Tax=viral metagenome TaxID=1070528 RepID=A0A6M3IQF1_9ZZZZ
MIKRLVLTCLLLLFVGCLNFKDHVIKISKEKGYTAEQADVIYHAVLQKELMDVEKDGSRTIKYDNYLTADDVLSQVDEMIEAIDTAFKPENKMTKVGRTLRDFPKMKEALEKNRRVLKFMSDRITGLKTYNEFKKLQTGKKEKKYSFDLLNPLVDVKDEFKFTSKTIEDAREKGKLTVIEDLIHMFDFEVKNQDPKYPNDTNRFIYEKKYVNLRIVVYDIGSDHSGDYVEVFRDFEYAPAMKIFKNEQDQLNIVVIDRDKYNEFGYMIPDVVREVYGIPKEKIAIYLTKDNTFVDDLYYEKPTEKEKIVPYINDNKLFFVKVGNIQLIDEFEINKNGWDIPIEYKDRLGNNYKPFVILKKPEKELIEQAKKDNVPVYGQILYVVRQYTSLKNEYMAGMGNVVEYYTPIDRFAFRDIAGLTINKRKIIIDQPGLPTTMGMSSIFTGTSPCIIEYSEGTNKWDIRYKLVDNDGDGKFEARKKIANTDTINPGEDILIKEKVVSHSYGDM